MNRFSSQYAVPRVSPVVKILLIVSAVVFLLTAILERTSGFNLTAILGFTPARLLQGFIWQPFTYVFLHASFFHLLFNLLVIWTVGSELEDLWGRRTFLSYLVVCGLGAALTYGVFSLVGIGPGAYQPVVGSSGIVYGLLLAYGILFGDRTMYFFMLFPMPARYFVMLLGGIELVSSVLYAKDGTAHLAHLGGMLFGFLFLASMARWRQRSKGDFKAKQIEKERQRRLKKASHLKLVNHEIEKKDPKHWN
jgi:membrane associated rhomboid family serine protease